EVGLRLRVAAPLFLGKRQRRLEVTLVDVDDVRDAGVLDAGQMLVMIESAAAGRPRRMALVIASQTKDCDIDRVIRTTVCVGTRRSHRQSNTCRGGFRQEYASVHHRRPPLAAPIARGSTTGQCFPAVGCTVASNAFPSASGISRM